MSDSTTWSIIIVVLIIAWIIYGIMKAGYDDDKFRAKGIKVETRILDKKNIGVSGKCNIKYKVLVEFEQEMVPSEHKLKDILHLRT